MRSDTASGFGLGLRPEHYADVLGGHEAAGRVDWFEAITENHLVGGGRPLHVLDRVRERWPVAMHGVSLSIGGTAPLDEAYLGRVRALADRCAPAWISDHLCWTGVNGLNLHDLLPLPYTAEALDHVAARVQHAQEILRRPLVLENVSSYVAYASDECSEWEFLVELVRRTGCELLLDVNNVYVGARNHGYDAAAFLDAIPRGAVRQFHLAGHADHGDHVIDTHDAPVCEAVWALYERAVRRFGAVPTLLERDDAIPPLGELVAELDRARAIATRVLATAAA
jgi:uncharacterized protein (UPF0276 family)